MTNAEALYSTLIGTGPISKPEAQQEIERLIRDKVVEGDFLEYKAADQITDSDIRRHWSKCLSAFANTGGGVLIWGVSCTEKRDSKTGALRDEPDNIALYSNVIRLRKYLADLISTSTADPVEGVRIMAVPFDGKDEGCVVCHVPIGKSLPYRAVHADSQYYIRGPERTAVVSHNLLRNLFFPRLSANLQVWVKGWLNKNGMQVFFDVTLKNAGTASSQDTIVVATFRPGVIRSGFHGDAWNEIHDVAQLPAQHYEKFRFIASRAIHPTFEQGLGTFSRNLRQFSTDMLPIFTLRFEIYSRDGEAQVLTTTLGTDEMMILRTKQALPDEEG